MHISYDGIVFDVVHLEDWLREAVYSEDQTTFLFWHHQIVVTCLLNVDATAANQFPPQQFVDGRPRSPNLPGAPGIAINSVPNNTIPTSSFSANSKDSGFGGGGDFAPGTSGGTVIPPADKLPNPALGTAIGGGTFVPGLFPPPPGPSGSSFIPLPPPPPGGFGGGGDFAPFKPKPVKPGRAKFFPDAGKKNPKAPNNQANNAPRGTVPFSDVELRTRLRKPRRQLLVWLDSGPNAAPEFMIVSPLHPDAGSDAMHGPVCTIMDIPEIHGNVSAILRLKFDTWEAPALEFFDQTINTSVLRSANLTGSTVEAKAIDAAVAAYQKALASGKSVSQAIADAIEAARKQGLKDLTEAQVEAVKAAGKANDPAGNKPGEGADKRRMLATPALLSNRWAMSFGWDHETYLRIQNIVGEAIFRMDVLHMRKLTADQLRGYIWHPIPAGYRRRPIGQNDIEISPGGNIVKYHICDEQVMMNFPGGVQFGMIHADVQMEFEYSGYDGVNFSGGSKAWSTESKMKASPGHTTK